jgi:zinc/manganese transport system substrate-binding protein
VSIHRKLLIFGAVLAALASARGSGAAEKPVVACTIPILESLAREVGGDDFEYFSLSKPDQDPHYVRATPVLQRKLRRADLFLEVGLQLELWADLVANQSGQSRLQRGQSGRIITSRGVPREQVPVQLTRAEGHVHPDGNPHIWLDPLRAVRMVENIAEGLISIAPDRKAAVERRFRDFRRRVAEALFGKALVDLAGVPELERRAFDGTLFAYLEAEQVEGKKLSERLGGWLLKARPLRGKKAVEYHQSWFYTAKRLGFDIVAALEERPGIPPGPRYQLELTKRIREEGMAGILVDNFYHPGLPQRISEDAGVPVVTLPNQPGGEPGTDSYLAFMDYVVERLLRSMKK